MRKFKLYSKKLEIGILTCGVTYDFELRDGINIMLWNLHGPLISVNEKGKRSELRFFTDLTRRLPIHLRNGGINKKLDYLAENGLRVASDNFYFVEINEIQKK